MQQTPKPFAQLPDATPPVKVLFKKYLTLKH